MCPDAIIEVDELNLDSVDSRYRRAALAAFDARDGFAFAAAALHATDALTSIIENWKLLQSRGMCESALTQAVFFGGQSNCTWVMGALEKFFASLDCQKLRACGDVLPPAERFVLYRGVAGAGQRRQIRGLSWTGSFDAACWFADRSRDFGDPGIYSATVSRSDIYVFSRRQGREDFLVRPRTVRRLAVALEDLRERHARVEDNCEAGDGDVDEVCGFQVVSSKCLRSPG